MAVVVDGFTVVVPKEALARRYPGGLEAYLRHLPNGTYCADHNICRVAFMVEADARSYVHRLVTAGLEGPPEGPSPDIAIVSVASGHLIPCDWLELQVLWHSSEGQMYGATVAKLPGDDVTTFAVPDKWDPKALRQISNEDLEEQYELVNVDRQERGSVATYRHRQTGEQIYCGRPDILRVAARYRELASEVGQIESMRGSQRMTAATNFLERATQLVEDTESQGPGPLLMKGIGGRLLARWDIAEQAFRAVTVLQPSFLSAWHELTWALASLGRLEEAEFAARHALTISPDNPASLGNLASVLRERGKLDEALTIIRRAIELNPADRMNEAILDQIRKDHGVPWYKRLFVN